MVRYDHLPIWKEAVALATLLEQAVRRFPRYHKYTLGSDLRRQAYAVCRGVVVANGEGEGRAHRFEGFVVGASAPNLGISTSAVAAKTAPTKTNSASLLHPAAHLPRLVAALRRASSCVKKDTSRVALNDVYWPKLDCVHTQRIL